ncbi:MAG: 2,3-bisphosphoglycerate-independent phosphoglycerate mutase [Clostridia bacterium]|nr:2,3-bisphosphoglycerate-independent phosphoglycerate mutase [Clostridia bacterium]
MKKPLVLVILDGYGVGECCSCNAISNANTPFMDKLMAEFPNSCLKCSGLDVGLPDGQMGNSEVGHTNMGAGRVVYQELSRITKDIKDGTFFKNEELLNAIAYVKKTGGKLHLWGLVSDGGVHSHFTHLLALIDLCKKEGVSPFVHCFTDGRDVSPTSAKGFIGDLQNYMNEQACGTVATVMGRFYAMDRDKRWERLQLAYDAITKMEGEKTDDFILSIEKSYEEGVTDEFLKPMVNPAYTGLNSDDAVIFFNFRPDRAREITAAFTEDECGLNRDGVIKPYYVCFTQYDESFKNVHIAFKPTQLTNIFGEYISKCGLKQLRIAETEKYAHVTFFFNGGEEKTFDGEKRVLIPSPKVKTYDEKPEMSAYEVAEAAVKEIKSGEHDVIILNFANCDMVGHTGCFEAAVNAVEAVDKCSEMVYNSVVEMGGLCLFTADHGNADVMANEDGTPFTAHTTNVVPLVICDKDIKVKCGRLCDLAPTMLELLGLDKPEEMTGESLIVK